MRTIWPPLALGIGLVCIIAFCLFVNSKGAEPIRFNPHPTVQEPATYNPPEETP